MLQSLSLRCYQRYRSQKHTALIESSIKASNYGKIDKKGATSATKTMEKLYLLVAEPCKRDMDENQDNKWNCRVKELKKLHGDLMAKHGGLYSEAR